MSFNAELLVFIVYLVFMVGIGVYFFLKSKEGGGEVAGFSTDGMKVSPKMKGMLEETYLRINIGLTFNERWFMKWKVD